MSEISKNKRRSSRLNHVLSPQVTPKRAKPSISKRAQTERKAKKTCLVENNLCTPIRKPTTRKSLLEKLAKTAPISRFLFCSFIYLL